MDVDLGIIDFSYFRHHQLSEITLDASTESYVEGDNINMFCAVSVPPHTSVSILWTKDDVKVSVLVKNVKSRAAFVDKVLSMNAIYNNRL